MERNVKQWEMNSSLAVGEWRTGQRVKAGTQSANRGGRMLL